MSKEKTLQELMKDWGESTCGKSEQQYVYDYFVSQFSPSDTEPEKVYTRKEVFGIITTLNKFSRENKKWLSDEQIKEWFENGNK